MSKFPIQEINPKSIYSLFTKLSENIAMKNVIDSRNYTKLDSIISSLARNEGLLDPNHININEIASRVHCSYCNENRPAVFPDCGHKICEKCAKLEIGQSTKNLIYLTKIEKKNVPKCPLCNTEIRNTQFSHLYPNWENLKTEAKRRKIQITKLKKCKNCQQKLNSEFFTSKNVCHSICNYCALKEIKNESSSCKICKEFINYREILNQNKCLYCSKTINYEQTFFVCKSHCFCFGCAGKMINLLNCALCEKEIVEEDYDDCIKNMYKTCDLCHKIKEKPFFVEKACCPKWVCLECQLQTAIDSCANCNSRINIL